MSVMVEDYGGYSMVVDSLTGFTLVFDTAPLFLAGSQADAKRWVDERERPDPKRGKGGSDEGADN